MVVMVMRQDHAAEPAARLDRLQQAVDMRFEQRAWVDDPCGFPVHDPGVGARERRRPGIRGAQPQDVVFLEQVRIGSRAAVDGGSGTLRIAFGRKRRAHGGDVS